MKNLELPILGHEPARDGEDIPFQKKN
jgi:hypothetical protein